MSAEASRPKILVVKKLPTPIVQPNFGTFWVEPVRRQILLSSGDIPLASTTRQTLEKVNMDGPDKGSLTRPPEDIEIDRSGLCLNLMIKASAFYCIGCLFAWPCISCYSNTQTVSVSEQEVYLSYDLSVCGKSERHVPMDRIQDVTVSSSICEKCSGTENVGIQTAGGAGPQAEILIMAPKQPSMVRDLILAHRRGAKSDGLGSAVSESDQTPLINPKSSELIELKDSVLRIEKMVAAGVNKM